MEYGDSGDLGVNIEALMNRIGFGVYYTILIRNPQNSIGNY